MKTNSFLKNMLKGTAILSLALFISSCKKDDIDENGSANIKVVNASPSSTAQGFFLADKTIVASGLDFTDASDYITTNSGNRLTAQFRNNGATTAYAQDNFDVNSNGTYTVFLAGDGQSARVKMFSDDLSAPASGQAKVRFVHLSDAAPVNIDIRDAAGNNLAANLSRDVATNFVAITPSVVSFQVFAAGDSNSLGTFDLSAFAAGKIYTVYITGSTAGSITVHQITHN